MWVVLFTVAAMAGADEACLEWHNRLPSPQGHNAFTDLISWNGAWYACFRHGQSHGSLDGAIHVLQSPDMKTWSPCAVLDTAGDDRDPHFVSSGDALHVYFGTWDCVHKEGAALPDRGMVRSYCASTHDGRAWSPVKGVWKPGWWLWRVRHYNGRFYSAAYTAVRPKPAVRETLLLESVDGLAWTETAVLTRERASGEADFLIRPDGELLLISRTGDKAGDAMLITGNVNTKVFNTRGLGVLVHSPALVETRGRLFVAGRGRDAAGYVTRFWELELNHEARLVELATLPGNGDTAYPGLAADPDASGDAPAFFLTWYSQHEIPPNEPARKDDAWVYAGRLVIKGRRQ